MTNRIALFLAALVIAVLAIDHFVIGFGLPLFLGRKFAQMVEYLAFWR
jgi:hypothetical protein